MTDDHPHESGLVEWIAMTVDCPEPDVMADFYSALCGGRVTRRAPGLASVDAGGKADQLPGGTGLQAPDVAIAEVPLHAHFEYVVQDPHAAAQHLLPLGASLATHEDPDDPHLVVMLDPAGHPFWLFRSSAAVRLTGLDAPNAAAPRPRLLIADDHGRIRNGDLFNKVIWQSAFTAAGLSYRKRADGMHALRHFYASVLLSQGVSIKELADYLGHADPAFTLRTYTHLVPSSHQRARAAIDGVFTPTAAASTDGLTAA